MELAEIVLPAKAPAWAKDREKLWNAAELVEKNGKRGPRKGQWKENVVVAREWFFALPAELSREGRLAVARIMAQYLADKHGIAIDFAIHKPGKEGDERNWHVHMLMTSRRMTEGGLGKKATEFSDSLEKGSELTKALRAKTAEILTGQLKKEGKAHLVKVEYKSYKARGVQRQPTRHQGPARTNMRRKQRRLEREAWEEEQHQRQQARQAKEAASLKMKQDYARQRMKAKLLQEQRDLKGRLKRKVREARAKDRPEGLRRWFLIATGRLGKAEFERQQRHGERVQEANERLENLRNVHRMEVKTFQRGQQMERDDLRERHASEDRQLDQAIKHRAALDRGKERQDRQPPEQSREREQQQYHGRELRLDLQ